MNLYQCEAKAKEIGFDKAKFVAMFPCGPVQCQWIDAYFGMLKVDADGLRDGFLMTKDVDKMFPNLFCSDPYVKDDVESIDSAVQNTETELQLSTAKAPSRVTALQLSTVDQMVRHGQAEVKLRSGL